MSRHPLAKDDQWPDSIGWPPSACVQGEGCVGDPVKTQQTRMGCYSWNLITRLHLLVGGWVLWSGFEERGSFACWPHGSRVIIEQKTFVAQEYNELASLDPCPMAWVSQQSE